MEDEQDTEKQELKQDVTAQGQKGKAQLKHPKVILLVIFFIASLVTLSSIYFFRFYKPATSPTKTIPVKQIEETADWKIYNSLKHNYSIKYPNTWIIQESNLNGINILGLGKSTKNGFTDGRQNILIEVTSSTLTNQQYIKDNIAPNSNPLKVGNLTIDRLTGEKWSFNSTTENDNYAVFINKNGKRYIIIKEIANKTQFKEYNTEIDQILSTFKFTDQTTPIPSVSSEPQMCAQVITPARNAATGECRDFPTPCDIPSGWEKVQSCAK